MVLHLDYHSNCLVRSLDLDLVNYCNCQMDLFAEHLADDVDL